MGYPRSGACSARRLAVALSLLAALAAVPASALAAGPGVPRTYKAQRIDSPNALLGGLFSLGMNLAGDLNRDGEEDLIVPQVPGFNTNGQVFAFSGENGALLDTIDGPDPSSVGGLAQFGLLGTDKVGASRGSAPFSDLGSCPGGATGQTCPGATIGAPDGVPDLLIGATGVDVGATTDAGRVYLIDGATRAVLKRIDIPAADRTALALTTGSTGFGREVGVPVGLPGCAGNAGVGTCTTGVPRAVEIGDMDGAGESDIVIGARRITESNTTAHPASQCARTAGALCRNVGRTYIYRGEDVVGSSAARSSTEPVRTRPSRRSRIPTPRQTIRRPRPTLTQRASETTSSRSATSVGATPSGSHQETSACGRPAPRHPTAGPRPLSRRRASTCPSTSRTRPLETRAPRT